VVVSPLGEVLAEAGESPERLTVDLPIDAVAAARRSLPVLVNARFREVLA
jgi:predicted amidohydrolase